MKLSTLLTWIPRVLSVLLTLALYGFLFQFTLENIEWSSFIYALIPGTVLFLLTLFSWLFPKPGGIVFVLLGAVYALYSFNQVPLTMLLIFSGVAIISGILYFLQKRPVKKVEREPKAPKREISKEDIPAMEKSEDVHPEMPKIEETEAKEELPPLPSKADKEEKKFETKEPPVLEAAPLRKAAEPESPDRKTKIPAWKGPRPHGSLPDISLTTGKPSVSGDAFETRKSSNNQPEAAGRKTDGPPQEFMKWVEKQKLR